jgi:hypothetical protein
MNEELEKKWNEAAATGKPIPIGRLVVCDRCDDDYTDKPDIGGFLFGSYAYCPKCAKANLPNIRKYGEAHLIKAHCQPDESFANFVRRMRGPDSYIQIEPLA